MKSKLLLLTLLLGVTPLGLFSQDQPAPSTTFNLQASAMSLSGHKQTVPGTVIGGTLAITPNFSIREDNVLVPAGNLQAFLGGFQYALPVLSKKVDSSTLLNGNAFQFYLTGSVGAVHIGSSAGDIQHIGVLGGGGLNYDPTGKGKFSVNLFEVRYAKLPGYANNTAIVSSGLKLGF